jgi:hypothetical protein
MRSLFHTENILMIRFSQSLCGLLNNPQDKDIFVDDAALGLQALEAILGQQRLQIAWLHWPLSK